MTVVPLFKEWVEVYRGTLDGQPKWFVEHHFGGAGLIVSDRDTEEEAMADAKADGLPVIRS